MSKFNSINYLNNVSDSYFDTIGSFDEKKNFFNFKKLNPLTSRLKNPKKILSVGIGSGIELFYLNNKYRNIEKIYGIDISRKSILFCKKKLVRFKKISLLEKDIVNLGKGDFKDSVDAIIMSSVMHEIFSFSGGKKSILKSLHNSIKILKKGGYLFIRDFSVPILENEAIELNFKSKSFLQFYLYFSKNYRKGFKEEKTKFFPIPIQNRVLLNVNDAAEMFLHYKNYKDHISKDIIKPFSKNWKEIKEIYQFIPELGYSNFLQFVQNNLNNVTIIYYNEYTSSYRLNEYSEDEVIITQDNKNITKNFFRRINSKFEIIIKT